MENEINKADEIFENDFRKMIYFFKYLNIRNNREVEILEEKFRFNVFDSIGEMFDLKNKK